MTVLCLPTAKAEKLDQVRSAYPKQTVCLARYSTDRRTAGSWANPEGIGYGG
jgi:hypothetical protein